MHRTLAVVLALLSTWFAIPVAQAGYVRLAYQPESKSGEFRVGHRIVQTTGANAGSVCRIAAGGDSNTRAGYSFICETSDTFDAGAWVNNPFTGGQALIEYVGTVREVATGGGADDTDIGDAGDAQCWQASADGDACLIIEDGTYDLPDLYDKRVAIYAAEGVTAVLQNDISALIDLTEELGTDYEAHRIVVVPAVHGAPDAVNVVTAAAATDLATCITKLNDIRTQCLAHWQLLGGVHGSVDAGNAITAAAATNLATAIVLAADIRAMYELHRVDLTGAPAIHGAVDAVNVVTLPDAPAYTGVTLVTDMSGVAANRGWLEIVGCEIEQTFNAEIWGWTHLDDMILFSRCELDYNNAAHQAGLFDSGGNDASLVHMLDCQIGQSGAGNVTRVFNVDIWTDYLIDSCHIQSVGSFWTLSGRGILRSNVIVGATQYVYLSATADGWVLSTNNIVIGNNTNIRCMYLNSTTTSRRVASVNDTVRIANITAGRSIFHAYGVGETIISGAVVESVNGNGIAFYATTNANQRLYNCRAYNVAALTSVVAPGTWVSDDNSILTAAPFVAPAAVPPDMRLNSTAGGGAACKGMVRRLPIVSPDTDITKYPRDRTAMADAGAWQSRDLVRLRLSGLSADDADFSTRLVTGMTSGATGLVRDWDDYRIIDTDGSGVETVRTGSDGGSVVVEVLSGTFQAETVRTLPDDYSDIPVGMWGGPFAPYRAEYRATAAAPDVVRTVRNKWSGTIQLADYLMTQSAYTAGAANEVIWIDDSEQYLNDLAIIARATRLMGAPWHLPEFYRPTGSLVFRSDTTSLAEFAYLRFVVDPADDGIVAGTAGHDIRVTDCEGFGRATHTQMIYTNSTGDLVVTDSLLFAQDGVGIQAKSTNITIVDTTVNYAAFAVRIVGGRTAGSVLLDRCKFWETNAGVLGGFYPVWADQDTAVLRNISTSTRTGGNSVTYQNVAACAAGTSILLENWSISSAGAAAGDHGIYIANHNAPVVTVRGCALVGPAGVAGGAFLMSGTANVTSEYNAWHNYASGFSDNWTDTGTVNSDPLFADVAAEPVPNLYPSSTSPLLALVAANATSNRDLDNRPRRRRATVNDAGAYERTGQLSGGQRTLRLFLGYGVEPQPGQDWFRIDETVTASGGATGVVEAVYGDDLIIDWLTGTWAATETLTGSTSGSTGTIVALGDVHTVSPRRDRDSDTNAAGYLAAANGDVLTHRDGWTGPAHSAKSFLDTVEPVDQTAMGAHPIAHARRMDPLRGRYVGMRGVAVFDALIGRQVYHTAAGTDGWQGFAGMVLTGENCADRVFVDGINGKHSLRDTLLIMRGLYTAGGTPSNFLSANDSAHVVGSWFRGVVGLTVPANVGLHVQTRLPDTAVTGTVVSRDNVHEDVTEHALYQDAAVPTAYDITVQRCLFRRYWNRVVNMSVNTAARLNVSLSQFYGFEKAATYAGWIQQSTLRGTARIEMCSGVRGPAEGSAYWIYLNDSAVAVGCTGWPVGGAGGPAIGGGGTTEAYDCIAHSVTVATEVNCIDGNPLYTDATPTAPDLHLQDGSPALGHVDPANLSLVDSNDVDYHGFPVFGYYPNIHAGCLQHPVPGRVPVMWGGMYRQNFSGDLTVPEYTRR